MRENVSEQRKIRKEWDLFISISLPNLSEILMTFLPNLKRENMNVQS